MNHPLTEEMTDDEYIRLVKIDDWNVRDFPYNMRLTANWQLEQVIEQWEKVIDSNRTGIQVIEEFDKRLKAMRPQENNNV